jgi:hypothetical protein
MTRRRVLCGLLLLSAVLACFAGWLWVESRPRATLELAEQVKDGMTRDEVVRKVGGPPDINTPWVDGIEQWSWDRVSLFVQFDAYGEATRVWVVETQPPTLTERIHRWLRLSMLRCFAKAVGMQEENAGDVGTTMATADASQYGSATVARTAAKRGQRHPARGAPTIFAYSLADGLNAFHHADAAAVRRVGLSAGGGVGEVKGVAYILAFLTNDPQTNAIVLGIIGGLLGPAILFLLWPAQKCPNCGNRLTKMRNVWNSPHVFRRCATCGRGIDGYGKVVEKSDG